MNFHLQITDLKEKLAAFVCSSDLEVQERSTSAVALLDCIIENPSLAKELSNAFIGDLNPVAPKAQRKVNNFDKKCYITSNDYLSIKFANKN